MIATSALWLPESGGASTTGVPIQSDLVRSCATFMAGSQFGVSGTTIAKEKEFLVCEIVGRNSACVFRAPEPRRETRGYCALPAARACHSLKSAQHAIAASMIEISAL